MRICQLQAIVSDEHTLTLQNVPFQPGETVEVTLCADNAKRRAENDLYPLRGKPIQYAAPFEAASQDEWEAAQ